MLEEEIKKINEIMHYKPIDGYSDLQIFEFNGGDSKSIPALIAIDMKHAGGLEAWTAAQLDVSGEKEPQKRLFDAVKKVEACQVFSDAKRCRAFPPLYNFYVSIRSLACKDKLYDETRKLAKYIWTTHISKAKLKANCDKMFSTAPDPVRFKAASDEIRKTWGFAAKDMDFFRYFICQVRSENLNPSLNKSLFMWGKAKQTGKTTIARAITTILNGDVFANFGNYESTLSVELQYGSSFDLPLAATTNAVLLDEAMPRDTKKVYGQLKGTITSNTCSYNQKYRDVTKIRCRRNYIVLSNENPDTIIQDEKERRFYVINIEKRHTDLSDKYSTDELFEYVYDLWKEFCINAVPEEDWQKWYDSFEMVFGAEHKEKEEIITEFKHKKNVYFPEVGASSYTTIPDIRKIMYGHICSMEQRKALQSVMDDLFSDCRPKSNSAMYLKSKCRAKIESMPDVEVEDIDPEADLPF